MALIDGLERGLGLGTRIFAVIAGGNELGSGGGPPVGALFGSSGFSGTKLSLLARA